MDAGAAQLHILILSDRDWTHPQGGGTGTNLYSQVVRWLAWGHRVSVIACSYPGATPIERDGGLTLHRIGGRSTVFPRAIAAQARGLVGDADVVLEVVNGITFLTPLWCRKPRVTLVHHIHADHYVRELGAKGRLAALALETLPLRLLYRRSQFLTISRSSAREIAAHGIDPERIEVSYLGVEHGQFSPDPAVRATEPTLLYLGRLKRYKRIEVVLDVLERNPGALLELAGEGDHRPVLEAEIDARGLRDRVRMHGHVSEERKLELYRRAWINITTSSAEGWGLSVTEAGACATPSAALRLGGLAEAIDDGRTGMLAETPAQLAEKVGRVLIDAQLRESLGRAAHARASEFSWDATARRTLQLLDAQRRLSNPGWGPAAAVEPMAAEEPVAAADDPAGDPTPA
ncbi:MAG TPA: glycosyltransferase family 4 protein [Gaiellales bacterium]|nr:glycosyltransferase family 4 protein [Gaiellales bacterium]